MISPVKGVLLCVKEKPWVIKKENKEGISYTALLYSEKDVQSCKISEEVYNQFKGLEDMEFLIGTAMVEIKKSTFNDKERVQFQLLSFTEKK